MIRGIVFWRLNGSERQRMQQTTGRWTFVPLHFDPGDAVQFDRPVRVSLGLCGSGRGAHEAADGAYQAVLPSGGERQSSWPVPTTTLAGGAGRKTGLPVWRAASPALLILGIGAGRCGLVSRVSLPPNGGLGLACKPIPEQQLRLSMTDLKNHNQRTATARPWFRRTERPPFRFWASTATRHRPQSARSLMGAR